MLEACWMLWVAHFPQSLWDSFIITRDKLHHKRAEKSSSGVISHGELENLCSCRLTEAQKDRRSVRSPFTFFIATTHSLDNPFNHFEGFSGVVFASLAFSASICGWAREGKQIKKAFSPIIRSRWENYGVFGVVCRDSQRSERDSTRSVWIEIQYVYYRSELFCLHPTPFYGPRKLRIILASIFPFICVLRSLPLQPTKSLTTRSDKRVT